MWEGLTDQPPFAALSNDHNDMIMNIIGWDAEKKIVKQLKKSGSRYIWEIKYDTANDVATFIGQGRKEVAANLVELLADPDLPTISTEDEKTFPPEPRGWKYVNLTDPDRLQFDPAHYPVFLYKGITYTGK